MHKPGTKLVQPQKLLTYYISELSTTLFRSQPSRFAYKVLLICQQTPLQVQNIDVSNDTL